MKERLSSLIPVSPFTLEELRSPVNTFRIVHVTLGEQDANSFLVMRELIRPISVRLYDRGAVSGHS